MSNLLRKVDGLGHFYLGLIIMIGWFMVWMIIVAITHLIQWRQGLEPIIPIWAHQIIAVICGWIAQFQHFISREERDFEVNAWLNPHKIRDVLYAYSRIKRWSRRDWTVPALGNGAVALLMIGLILWLR